MNRYPGVAAKSGDNTNSAWLQTSANEEKTPLSPSPSRLLSILLFFLPLPSLSWRRKCFCLSPPCPPLLFQGSLHHHIYQLFFFLVGFWAGCAMCYLYISNRMRRIKTFHLRPLGEGFVLPRPLLEPFCRFNLYFFLCLLIRGMYLPAVVFRDGLLSPSQLCCSASALLKQTSEIFYNLATPSANQSSHQLAWFLIGYPCRHTLVVVEFSFEQTQVLLTRRGGWKLFWLHVG